MAIDMFLKFDTIKGESKDAQHAGEIDVLAWSWGLSNSTTAQAGGGAGAGKVNIQDLAETSYIDASFLPLLTAASTGRKIKTAVLTVRRVGTTGKGPDYLAITLADILV